MQSQSAKSFWITEERQSELRHVTVPVCKPDQVKIRTLYTAISRGTELLVFNNQVPPSEYERMQAPFQDGKFPYPVKYGYINVGLVEAGEATLRGKTVFCLYPHQSEFVVPATAVAILPVDVPAERAVLAANMETAINALWDAEVAIGSRVSVVGAGVIGCLVAYLASKIAGTEVQLIDTNRQREKIAKSLGINFCTPERASTNRDLVIHASATSDGLNNSLTIAGMEARVLELSWFGSQRVTIELGAHFHAKRLQICCSQVGQISPAQRIRWSHARRLRLALALLSDPVLDCLITDESHFDELPETLQALASGRPDTLCHRIRY